MKNNDIIRQMASGLINVCQQHKLKPEEGITYMMRTVAGIVRNTGLILGVPDVDEFVYDTFQQIADQLKEKNSLDSHS